MSSVSAPAGAFAIVTVAVRESASYTVDDVSVARSNDHGDRPFDRCRIEVAVEAHTSVV